MSNGGRILMFGARDWTDRDTVAWAMTRAIEKVTGKPLTDPQICKTITIVHGASPAGGADAIIDDAARAFGCIIEPHPPDFSRFKSPTAFWARNQDMADLGALCGVGFWNGHRRPNGASGTSDMMERALRAGIACAIIPPGARKCLLLE